MPRIYLSLGSNVDREYHVRACLDRLRELFGALEVSPVYRCPAVGFEGEEFYNLAVGADTGLAPDQLLPELKALEDELGRRRDQPRFSDRTIDVDLLLYDDRVGRYAGAELPRPEILEQPFVLKPLADLAPELVHPSAGRPLGELWLEMAAAGHELIVVDLP